MSDQPIARQRVNHVPFIIAVAVLLVIGIVVYVKATSEPKQDRVKLALVTWNEDPFWDAVIQGAQDSAQQANAELTVIRSKPDMETQSQHVRDLLAKGIQGIAISPNNPKEQAAVLNEAADKAVLITFDADAPDSKRRLFVGTDGYLAGQLAAEEVRSAIPDGGSVIISVGSVEMINGRDRRQGLIDNLLERSFKRDWKMDALDASLKGEKYSIAATVIDGGDAAKSATLIADALKAHPDVKCIVGLFSYSAGAALEGIQQAGKSGQVKIVAFDETEATQAGLEQGTIFASILQDQYRCGHEAVRVLADAIRGVDQLGPEGPRMVQVAVNVLHAETLGYYRDRKLIRPILTKPSTQPVALGR